MVTDMRYREGVRNFRPGTPNSGVFWTLRLPEHPDCSPDGRHQYGRYENPGHECHGIAAELNERQNQMPVGTATELKDTQHRPACITSLISTVAGTPKVVWRLHRYLRPHVPHSQRVHIRQHHLPSPVLAFELRLVLAPDDRERLHDVSSVLPA